MHQSHDDSDAERLFSLYMPGDDDQTDVYRSAGADSGMDEHACAFEDDSDVVSILVVLHT